MQDRTLSRSAGGSEAGLVCRLMRGLNAPLSKVYGLGAGAEKTSNTRYWSYSQGVLVCLQAEHIAITLLSIRGVTGLRVGRSWDNELNHIGFAKKAGCR